MHKPGSLILHPSKKKTVTALQNSLMAHKNDLRLLSCLKVSIATSLQHGKKCDWNL